MRRGRPAAFPRLGSPVIGRYADYVPEFERSQRPAAQQSGISFEKAVIKKLGDFSKLRGADLYVFRVGGEEHSHFSQPCADCQMFLKKCMREYGLRFVFYSI
jgi:hypothetical protein